MLNGECRLLPCFHADVYQCRQGHFKRLLNHFIFQDILKLVIGFFANIVKKIIVMQEHEIRFKSNEIELAGTLVLPGYNGPFPAILFITGSGQIDQNENHEKFRLNAFDDISHYLAENGVASLRYDKRGIRQNDSD